MLVCVAVAKVSNRLHPSDLAKQTILTILKEEMDDIIQMIKSLEYSGLLMKGVHKTIKNQLKEQKCGFLSMLLGTLGVSLLGNLLTRKGVKRRKYLAMQAKIPWKRSIESRQSSNYFLLISLKRKIR